MISYHPIFDMNHSIYRLLRLLHVSEYESIDWDLLKLLDFYTVFPSLMKQISPLPQAITPYRQTINTIPEPYEEIPNPRRILFEAGPIQDNAVRVIVAKGFADIDDFLSERRIKLISIPEQLRVQIKEDAETNDDWFDVIANQLPAAKFMGRDGLKQRSGLLEYRYDL